MFRAQGRSITRPARLEQGIDEGSDGRTLGEQQQESEHQEDGHHRNKPPELLLPEELKELAHDRGAAGETTDPFIHPAGPPLCLAMTWEPNTSVSMSLRRKVEMAWSGLFTMGSPLRLNDVLRTTGTPVSASKASINL